jgi:hypothetical protein
MSYFRIQNDRARFWRAVFIGFGVVILAKSVSLQPFTFEWLAFVLTLNAILALKDGP